MARQYHVEGTRTYLIAALVLFVLCLWFGWDGWFPRDVVLERHPDPGDSFYGFNKSLALVFLVGWIVCGYIHFVVR